MKNQQIIITEGNRAVVINAQYDDNGEPNAVWANLYVNARNGLADASITLTRWEGKTIKGAEKWAKKTLAK